MDNGIKIVCIDDQNWPAWAKAIMTDFPIKGKIYTIRDIIYGQTTDRLVKDPTGKNPFSFEGTLMPTVLLEEIKNPIPAGKSKECGYAITRFAPIDPPKKESEIKKQKDTLPKVLPILPKNPKKKEKELVEI